MVTVPIQQVSSSVPLLILQSSISHLLNQYLLPVKNHSLQLSPPTSALQQSSSVLEMYYNLPPRTVSPDPVAIVASRAVDPVGSPSSTTIDQDEQSTSTSQTNQEIQSQVTHQGTEFLNKTLHAYFKEEGIEHQTSTPRTPEQNGVVERRNRTLVEAARTMLSASKLPLSFWAEAVATACYTQNRSIIISTHGKTAYHIINDRKPSIKHLHIFGCICYITRDGENLDKMKEKGDPCVMVGYSTQSKGYRVYNKRTRLIVESIHIKFDEIKEMMSDHNSSDLAPQRQEMSVENVSSGLVPQGQKASDYDNSDPMPPRQNVVPTAEKTDSSQQGLEFLFSPLLEEYYNPTHGQAEENNNDQAPNASFQEAEFINPFCTRVQEIGESSSRNIDNTDVHSFQPQSHDYRWTRDHPLEQVRGNPTMPVQTRRQLATDPEIVDLDMSLMGGVEILFRTSDPPDPNKHFQTLIMPDALILAKALLEGYSSLVISYHKVVRLGINPMIQPEPEDLPKDNPKLEIAVLRVILFSIHNDEWKSFQCHHQTALRKANVVADALSRKEREPLRVRALVMTIGLDLPKQILKAQTEARKP
ncbi:putative zinc finger, CCHC-type containing protein, partial [Tanacetum coccineum]